MGCLVLGLPKGYFFLRSKDRKKLLLSLQEQFGVDSLPEGVYLQNNKDKVYLITRDLERIPFEELLIDSLGLYFGTWQGEGFRLSIEGSQLLFPQVKKNVVVLDSSQRNSWLRGEDIPWDADSNRFVIVTDEKGDVLGCGRLRAPKLVTEKGVLMNYVPKARRLVVINE